MWGLGRAGGRVGGRGRGPAGTRSRPAHVFTQVGAATRQTGAGVRARLISPRPATQQTSSHSWLLVTAVEADIADSPVCSPYTETS